MALGGFIKKIIFSLCVLFSFSAFAGEGEPVNDQQLFKALHDRYDGTWMDEMDGSVTSENLKDGSILVELSNRFAEFSFYNVPNAKEDFQYIPSTITSGWLNYFDRTGSSIKCGESSYDLKRNPFPLFKCRMTVDKEGNVKSFMDRSALTSNAKPGSSEGWEDGTLDFHWREVSELKSSANACRN